MCMRNKGNMAYSAFDAPNTYDAMQQTNGINDQLPIGRRPRQSHRAIGYMRLEAKME
jgi:hypothetical protein